jgi:hypothetical protein
VVELKDSKSEADSDSESNIEGGKWIIDVEPSATVATTKVQPSEPEEPEEGEHLFHSQMWVKGALLHFIVDSGSQKNLISAEVVKWLDLPMTPHPHPYTIGWLHQGRDLYVLANNVICPMTSSLSKMRYCVIFLPLKFVMLF